MQQYQYFERNHSNWQKKMQVKTKIKITNVGKSRQKEGQLKTLIKFPKDKKKAN